MRNQKKNDTQRIKHWGNKKREKKNLQQNCSHLKDGGGVPSHVLSPSLISHSFVSSSSSSIRHTSPSVQKLDILSFFSRSNKHQWTNTFPSPLSFFSPLLSPLAPSFSQKNTTKEGAAFGDLNKKEGALFFKLGSNTQHFSFWLPKKIQSSFFLFFFCVLLFPFSPFSLFSISVPFFFFFLSFFLSFFSLQEIFDDVEGKVVVLFLLPPSPVFFFFFFDFFFLSFFLFLFFFLPSKNREVCG